MQIFTNCSQFLSKVLQSHRGDVQAAINAIIDAVQSEESNTVSINDVPGSVVELYNEYACDCHYCVPSTKDGRISYGMFIFLPRKGHHTNNDPNSFYCRNECSSHYCTRLSKPD